MCRKLSRCRPSQPFSPSTPARNGSVSLCYMAMSAPIGTSNWARATPIRCLALWKNCCKSVALTVQRSMPSPFAVALAGSRGYVLPSGWRKGWPWRWTGRWCRCRVCVYWPLRPVGSRGPLSLLSLWGPWLPRAPMRMGRWSLSSMRAWASSMRRRGRMRPQHGPARRHCSRKLC